MDMVLLLSVAEGTGKEGILFNLALVEGLGVLLPPYSMPNLSPVDRCYNS